MAYRKRVQKTGLKKRWYVNAGMNLPVLGKTTINMGNQKFKRAVKAIVRRSVMEPGLDQVSTSTTNLTHSTLYTYNITARIAQGVGTQNRQMDTVFLKYFKAKIRSLIDFSTLPTNALNCHVRVLVFKSSVEFDPSALTFGSGFGSSQLFLNAAQPDFSYVDTREIKLLYDKTLNYTTEAGTDIGKKIYHNEITIPLNESFRYRDAAGTYGRDHNLYMVIIPSCPEGVTGTTIVMPNHWMEGIVGFSSSQ